MKIRVVYFGRATRLYDDQVETYRRRIRQRWGNDEIRLKAVSGGRAADPLRSLAKEAEAIRKTLISPGVVAVLDEGGRSLDSESFASLLAAHDQNGVTALNLVIGSDLGLDTTLLNEADHILSLSAMTLPHQMARLLLWEQIFRSTHILGGGAYHRKRLS